MAKVNRILIVGLGSIGKRHLNNIQKLMPQASLAVLRSRPTNQSVAGCEMIASLKDAVEFRPDMALICNPSSFHLEVAKSLAAKCIHLFIEKPLSNQVRGVKELIEMIDRCELKAMVGYNLRFSPSLQAFKSLLDTGKYGRTLMVSAEVGQFLPSWRPGVDYRSTVSARADLGGGALLELSHELDYLMWLFGKAISTSARMTKVSDLDIDVEDLVLAHIDFEGHGRILPASVQLDFIQCQPYRRCKAVCEQATLVWDAVHGRVEVHHPEGDAVYFQDDGDRNYTYEQELTEFIDCIETGGPVPVSVHDGLRVLELVEAMRKSSESGEVVRL